MIYKIWFGFVATLAAVIIVTHLRKHGVRGLPYGRRVRTTLLDVRVGRVGPERHGIRVDVLEDGGDGAGVGILSYTSMLGRLRSIATVLTADEARRLARALERAAGPASEARLPRVEEQARVTEG